jgi:hypothetical protein
MSAASKEELAIHERKDELMHAAIHGRFDKLEKSVKKWGLFGGFIAGLASAGVHLVGCAGILGPGGTRPSESDLAVYAGEQEVCVTDYTTRETIDACRTLSRARWCAKWPSEVNCGKDAGQ